MTHGALVARALIALTQEHGAPNNFRASEVANWSSTLNPMDVGQAIRRENVRIDQALREYGFKFAGWYKDQDGTWLSVEGAA